MGAGPEVQLAIGVPERRGVVGLDVALVDSRSGVFLLHHQVGFGKPFFKVAGGVAHMGGDVGGFVPGLAHVVGPQVFMEQRGAVLHGLTDIHNGFQYFVIDLDQRHGRLGHMGIHRGDRSDGMAFEQSFIAGHHVVGGELEGRVFAAQFWAVRLSYNADIREDEPRVLFLGQCHAEEIYGVEITMELIDMFLHPDDHLSYRQNMQAILESSEIWIVPTHNPEGLTVVHGYTDGEEWLQDVTFRKNKRDTDLDGMFDFLEGVGNDSDGVDLNRNYDFNWIFGDGLWEEDNSGGTYQAHFDYYRGEAPLSELETQAIQDLALNERFLLSIAYHSSRSGNVSEQVIYPWLWAEGKMSPDGAIISTIGEAITSLLPNEAGDGYYQIGRAHV